LSLNSERNERWMTSLISNQLYLVIYFESEQKRNCMNK